MTQSPLELPGWLEFNTWRTGLTALPHSSPSNEGSVVTGVLYVDRRGRVVVPPNNPYLPVGFHSEVTRPSSRTADWLRLAAPLVDEMRKRGVVNQVQLPPEIEDVRPWTWSRFLVGVQYTYVVPFPFDASVLSRRIRRDIEQRRAGSPVDGLTPMRVSDPDLVLACLAASEARKGFSNGLGRADLDTLARLVGDEHLRMYACIDPQGQFESTEIVIHAPGARAIGWVHGSTASGLAHGAAATLRWFVFDDLATAGATGIDLCGANIPAVAAFKASSGAMLQPTFSIRSYSGRSAARFAIESIKARRRPTGE